MALSDILQEVENAHLQEYAMQAIISRQYELEQTDQASIRLHDNMERWNIIGSMHAGMMEFLILRLIELSGHEQYIYDFN